MLKSKKYIFTAIFGFILLVVSIPIALITFFPSRNTPQPGPEITPTISPATQIEISKSPETKTNPPVQYNIEKTRQMVDSINNKTPLSQSDSQAKTKILSLLPSGQVSGVVYQSSLVVIDYTNAADRFQAEIQTVDIAQAKTDASTWLKSQGLSQKGICDLPLVFYLSGPVLAQLRGSNFIFNPLAEGC